MSWTLIGAAAAGAGAKGLTDLAGSWASSEWQRNVAEGLSNHSARLAREYDLWQAQTLYPAQLKAQLDAYDDELALNTQRTWDSQREQVAAYRSALEKSGYNPLLAVGDVGGGSIQPLAVPDKSGNFSGSNSARAVTFDNVVDKALSMAQQKQVIANLAEQGNLIKANVEQVKANTAHTLADIDQIVERTRKTGKEADIVGEDSWVRRIRSMTDYIDRTLSPHVNSAEKTLTNVFPAEKKEEDKSKPDYWSILKKGMSNTDW